MKRLLLILAIVALPLFAGEIWLGMVIGVEGDSLILADYLKVYAPSALRQYVGANHEAIDVSAALEFPYTASLILEETEDLAYKGIPQTTVKIHQFYDVVDGRLIERSMH